MTHDSAAVTGFLAGVRVLEVGDELGEYCGRLLAGLGADVIKVEPPGGNETRAIGPFFGDEPDPERSLYFWHYNFGKRGITLDLASPQGRGALLALARRSDAVIDGGRGAGLAAFGLDHDALRAANPGLVVVRITPFGEDGPWAGHKGSELVHLALGGVMMNCGYDPEPSGFYDTPPVGPKMWQPYQITGEHAVHALLGALVHRDRTGRGQRIDLAVHECTAKATENDLPSWIYNRTPFFRQTGRHSAPGFTAPRLCATKDGRWEMLPSAVETGGGGSHERLVGFLDRFGLADDLTTPTTQTSGGPPAGRSAAWHVADVEARFTRSFLYPGKWKEAQEAGLLWAPVRRPEENLSDPHWRERGTFGEVEHPDLGRSFDYVLAKWVSPGVPWRTGPRAPHIGEHNAEVLTDPSGGGPTPRAATSADPSLARPAGGERAPHVPTAPLHGRGSALTGVRIVDFTWWLASGGAGRFLAAQGAEVIKMEWKGRWDLRYGPPAPTRDERDAATAPVQGPPTTSPNRYGVFNDIHSGKLGISLNMQHPKARAILAQLLERSNAVAEGFTSGVMESWGFGYERMRAINPSIVYVQQSSFGAKGHYAGFRSTGQIAAAFSGITELTGLPEPYPPCGIGYSYLDWFGAYNLATALLAALYRQQRTGLGVHIDSSQIEAGTFLVGTSVLDWSANGRRWRRVGNRSPDKPAAPHGAYRCAGGDRWIALGCFTEEEWRSLAQVLGLTPEDPRFATLVQRLANQDAVDLAVEAATTSWEPYALMAALQSAGVPAGVCQTSGDRCDTDPQLRHLRWLTEVPHTEIGTWPIKGMPSRFSETQPNIGGPLGRAAPCYAEDNAYVYGEILGMSAGEIATLEEDGVI